MRRRIGFESVLTGINRETFCDHRVLALSEIDNLEYLSLMGAFIRCSPSLDR